MSSSLNDLNLSASMPGPGVVGAVRHAGGVEEERAGGGGAGGRLLGHRVGGCRHGPQGAPRHDPPRHQGRRYVNSRSLNTLGRTGVRTSSLLEWYGPLEAVSPPSLTTRATQIQHHAQTIALFSSDSRSLRSLPSFREGRRRGMAGRSGVPVPAGPAWSLGLWRLQRDHLPVRAGTHEEGYGGRRWGRCVGLEMGRRIGGSRELECLNDVGNFDRSQGLITYFFVRVFRRLL